MQCDRAVSSHVYSLQSSPPQWCRQPTLRNKSPHIASLQYPGCQQPVGPVCTNNTPVFRLGAAWLGAAWPRLVCFKSLNGKLITAANMCSAVATTHHQDMWHGRRSSGGNAAPHHHHPYILNRVKHWQHWMENRQAFPQSRQMWPSANQAKIIPIVHNIQIYPCNPGPGRVVACPHQCRLRRAVVYWLAVSC